MNKNYFTAILVLFFANISIAQFKFPDKKKVEDFINRTLVVEKISYNDWVIEAAKNSKDTSALRRYKERVDSTNKFIEKYFKKEWKHNTKIEFKTKEEIDNLSKSDNAGNYALFSPGWSYRRYGASNLDSPDENERYYTAYLFSFSAFFMEDAGLRDLLGNFSEKKYMARSNKLVFDVSLLSDYVSEANVIFVLQQFNNYFDASIKKVGKSDFFNVTQNIETLKSKTLLFDKKEIDYTESEIKEMYPNSFKIVDRAEIERAILSKDKTTSYFITVYSELVSMDLILIVDCEDGKIRSKIGTGGGKNYVNYETIVKGKFGELGYLKVAKFHIKLINSKLGQKTNNMKE